MDERLSQPSPSWHPVETLPVALVAYLGTILVATLFGVLLDPDIGFVLGALAFEVLLGVVTVVWVRARRGNLAQLGLERTAVARNLGVGLASGLLLFAVTTLAVAPVLFWLFSLIAGHPVTPPQQEVLPDAPTTLHLAITGVAVVVAAPVGEELLFRGFLFGSLRRRMGFWPSALVSGAVFAAVHIIPLLMPLLFVVGLGLAYVYERRRSLWASMGAHAAFNLVGYALIVSRI